MALTHSYPSAQTAGGFWARTALAQRNDRRANVAVIHEGIVSGTVRGDGKRGGNHMS